MVEVATGIISSLLTVFSVQVAFLGFLCALFFTKRWEPEETKAFKWFIGLIFISVVLMGIYCIYTLFISLFEMWLMIVVTIVIVCLIVGGLLVTAVAVKRK